jgi:hypothetical protein
MRRIGTVICVGRLYEGASNARLWRRKSQRWVESAAGEHFCSGRLQ